ncbi:BQ5605_C018g08648 [Microbotryum silenes-dioicae]|uniref:BQ5605_C018g08648 protein n=1 Tax=Microbotryum silenes-dioicae TaxID=796604 RepID=A0A2X0M0J9_9BASI|nr:BQ5605_C018g08648 [Microbotryum silenes-dioicae]
MGWPARSVCPKISPVPRRQHRALPGVHCLTITELARQLSSHAHVMSKTALVVGGSRGLGLSLLEHLHSEGYEVVTTVRSLPESPLESIQYIPNIDLSLPGASASTLTSALRPSTEFDLVIVSAGYFKDDTLQTLDWEEMNKMFQICAIAPAFIVGELVKQGSIRQGGKVVLVTTEGGSIRLRTREEGGGNYGHHASKAAANMVGKLLSIDLAKQGITLVNIHPGFMKTEMTANIGYDKFYDEGGAVEPEEAAKSLIEFVEKHVDDSKNGSFWAPRGPRDVGEAERVLGKDLPTPLELPW